VTFLSKPVDVDELLAAIREVLHSQAIAKAR
jgi:DNA-binding response OmpR family regulator